MWIEQDTLHVEGLLRNTSTGELRPPGLYVLGDGIEGHVVLKDKPDGSLDLSEDSVSVYTEYDLAMAKTLNREPIGSSNLKPNESATWNAALPYASEIIRIRVHAR